MSLNQAHATPIPVDYCGSRNCVERDAYDAALTAAKSGQTFGPMSSGDLLARAMETPAHHEAAMQVLYANPGMTYDRACEIAQGQPRPEAPRSAQHARQPVTSYDPSRAMEAPPYHNAAMTYMLAHPGMMYSEAVAHVTGGK